MALSNTPDFEAAMLRYLQGDLKVMPIGGEFDIHKSVPVTVKRPPRFYVSPPTEDEIARLPVPSGAPTSKFIEALETQRAQDTAKGVLEKKASIDKETWEKSQREMQEFQRDIIKYMSSMMEMQNYRTTKEKEPEHYKGNNRVKIDVRLHQRQIEEAMSVEAKAFKQMVQRGLDKELLHALTATEGFGMVKEDWEVLRTSLIEMIQAQARLYFQQNHDPMRNGYEATVTFEIPKMTLSFRMPVDRVGFED